ncbi:MAG: hypothetical protein J6D03_10520 [Clostridia bacterium]|nr:hypothetical protein [Clostridia bacterium]
MLNQEKLFKEIKKAFDETFPTAFEHALKSTFPTATSVGNDIAKQFGKSINESISEPLAQRLAAAIDYYVRNANIYGTIITVGSPTTQMANINSPKTLTNGKVPNTLGLM